MFAHLFFWFQDGPVDNEFGVVESISESPGAVSSGTRLFGGGGALDVRSLSGIAAVCSKIDVPRSMPHSNHRTVITAQ